MEPKTKLQKKVVALSKNLKPISKAQIQWASSCGFETYYVLSRKTFYCLECGHAWKGESPLAGAIIGLTCPACKHELKQYQYTRVNHDYIYHAIFDTVEDMQVVRILFVKRYLHKLKPPDCEVYEVMQHWISKDGNCVKLSKSVHGFTAYYDSWATESKLEVRSETDSSKLRSWLRPYAIHPVRHILPEIKRNGFKGNYYSLPPQLFFSLILAYSKAETLLKSKQIKLLDYMANHVDAIEKNWQSIKTCIRNKYIIKDASTWIDHLELLRYFNKDLSHPKYVCPANLKAEHQRYNNKIRAIHKMENKIKLQSQMDADQLEYEKIIARFSTLYFTDGRILIKPLLRVEDFFEESETHHHCVFDAQYYRKKDCLILSSSMDNTLLETIQVSLSKMEVVQCRGLNNQTTAFHTKILDMVNQNMPQIAKLMAVA